MKISIIVPVYNAERYLDKLVQSVLSQTYEDYELILVELHSVKELIDIDTLSILNELQD